MKPLFVALVLLVGVSLALPATPYITARMSESLTLHPAFVCKGTVSLMAQHGDWRVAAQTILSRSASTFLSQVLDVGFQPAPSTSLSCSVYQLPLVPYQMLWLSGVVTLASETLHEKDPAVKVESVFNTQLSLAPAASLAAELDSDLSIRWRDLAVTIETVLVPMPIAFTAEATATLQWFSNTIELGNHDLRIRGSALAETSIIPWSWSYHSFYLTLASGRLSGSLSLKFVPGADVSVGLSLSHPLDVF